MNIKQLEAVVEAILFTMGESVEVERLAAALEHDEETVRKIIRSMMTRYDEEDRGVHIIELDGAYSKETCADRCIAGNIIHYCL